MQLNHCGYWAFRRSVQQPREGFGSILREVNQINWGLLVQFCDRCSNFQAVGEPPGFGGVHAHPFVEPRNSDHPDSSITLFAASVVQAMRNHHHVVPETGQPVGLGMGLRADAAVCCLRRVLLGYEGEPHRIVDSRTSSLKSQLTTLKSGLPKSGLMLGK